jgi:hypothetical protein
MVADAFWITPGMVGSCVAVPTKRHSLCLVCQAVLGSPAEPVTSGL